jgi:septal ring factor EnvC (AmiA/AmiB activator)
MNRVFLILFLALTFAGNSAYAKTDEKLREVEQQLSEKKQQQDALDAAAREASKGLEDLRAKLIQSTQTLQEKETQQETLEDKLDDLTGQIAAKSKNEAAERAQLSLMVSALVEIASRPPESLFLQNHVTEDHIHRSLLLKAILPRLKEDAASAARDLAALYDLQTQLAEQKRLVEASQQNLQQQQHDLDQLISTRQGFLQRTEQQKADIAQHLAALTDQARDLRQLMERVAPKQKTPHALSRDTVALKWPVSGAVRWHFGDKDADGVTSEGVTFAAPSGAPVVAPQAGKVVFAGPFRGYGQIMILQHANGYHSFLSGFGRIDAEMGQEVAAGEPLGVLPVKTGTKPELYFEWRRGEEPVDPINGLGKL